VPTFRSGLTHDWGLSATVSWLLYYIEGNLFPRLAFSSYQQGVSHPHCFVLEMKTITEQEQSPVWQNIKIPQQLAVVIIQPQIRSIK
jgi:hypothetical protein